MDTRPFQNASPQGFSVNGAATNVSIHQSTNDTMNERNPPKSTHVVNKASGRPTHNAKPSKKRKFEEVGSDDAHRQSIESSKKTPKFDHSRSTPQSRSKPNNEVIHSSPTLPLQQEPNGRRADCSPTPPLPQASNNEAANSQQVPGAEQDTNDEDADHSSEEGEDTEEEEEEEEE
jgi:hypothetical protein